MGTLWQVLGGIVVVVVLYFIFRPSKNIPGTVKMIHWKSEKARELWDSCSKKEIVSLSEEFIEENTHRGVISKKVFEQLSRPSTFKDTPFDMKYEKIANNNPYYFANYFIWTFSNDVSYKWDMYLPDEATLEDYDDIDRFPDVKLCKYLGHYLPKYIKSYDQLINPELNPVLKVMQVLTKLQVHTEVMIVVCAYVAACCASGKRDLVVRNDNFLFTEKFYKDEEFYKYVRSNYLIDLIKTIFSKVYYPECLPRGYFDELIEERIKEKQS